MANPSGQTRHGNSKFQVGDRVKIISLPAGFLRDIFAHFVHVGDAGIVSKINPSPGSNEIFVKLDSGIEVPLSDPIHHVEILTENRKFRP